MLSFAKKMSVNIFVGKKIRHFLSTFFLPISYPLAFKMVTKAKLTRPGDLNTSTLLIHGM